MATKKTARERVLGRALELERSVSEHRAAVLREARQRVEALTAQLHERDNYIETLKRAVNANAEEIGRLQKERDLAIQDESDASRNCDALRGKMESQRARAEHFRQQREVLLDLMMVASEKLPWEQGS